MEQIIDLGTNTFDSLGQGQCLLSRTSATFIFPSDPTYSTRRIIDVADFRDIWVIAKREVTLNLRLETSWRFVSSLPTVVKHLVGTLESILAHINPRLHVSKTSQECYNSAEHANIQITIALCESLVPPRDSLKGRLPRLVQRWLRIEPSPPPEIMVATLSNVTIHLQTPLGNDLWGICLTKQCLLDSSRRLLLHNNAISLRYSEENSQNNPLRSHNESAESFNIENTLGQEAVGFDNIMQRVRNSNSHTSSETAYQFETLLDYSIQRLIFKQPPRRLKKINESRGENFFSLSEIAPSIFRPGYCDNIRCRAGLLPVVTKAIGLLFQTCAPNAPLGKGTFAASRLGRLCENTESETTENLRSLIGRTMWRALQAGTYKTAPTKLATSSPSAPPSDDTMLMEDWDPWPESDEEIMFSYEDPLCLSVGSYVSFSEKSPSVFSIDCDNHDQSDDTAVFNLENSHYDYGSRFQLPEESISAMHWSVSKDMEEPSYMTFQSSISCGSLSWGQEAAFRDYQRAHGEDLMAEDTLSLPISSAPSSLVNSAFQDVPLSPISMMHDDNTDFVILEREIRPSEHTASIRNILAI